MSASARIITSVDELMNATGDNSVKDIRIQGELKDVPSFRLAPGCALSGQEDGSALIFASGSDGIALTTDNQLDRLHLRADLDRRAIWNDSSVDTLGYLSLSNISVTGQVQILARDRISSGHVDINGLDIAAADTRALADRPQGYGVSVLQGAFTLWNMQPAEKVIITASLNGLKAGRINAPVRGSGIFVSGSGDSGGRLIISQLETEAVYSDGGIIPGTPDQISGAVFTVYGAHVNLVRNRGPVTTYGVNDMVLDNWGVIDRWIAEKKLTSYGPSGIGYVNFGTVNELCVQDVIETFGQGARGFNVYTGTVRTAEFNRIVTHGDGAVGIQISQPVGQLIVHRGIETYGGRGESLIKGVLTSLSAVGLSIKPGGLVQEVHIAGGITANGKNVQPLEVQGVIDHLHINGGLNASRLES